MLIWLSLGTKTHHILRTNKGIENFRSINKITFHSLFFSPLIFFLCQMDNCLNRELNLSMTQRSICVRSPSMYVRKHAALFSTCRLTANQRVIYMLKSDNYFFSQIVTSSPIAWRVEIVGMPFLKYILHALLLQLGHLLWNLGISFLLLRTYT